MRSVARFMKRKAKRAVKGVTLGFLFPLAYSYFSRKPVAAGRVLFLETKEREMPDSFQLLYKRLEEDPAKTPRYFTLEQNHVSYTQYLKNCIQALHDISRVEVVVLSDASDLVSCIKMRPETKAIQLWHACGAFKKWGMSTAELKFGGSREDLLRHPFYKNLSLVTVSSPEVVWAYEEAMVLEDQPGVVRPIGVSRTDKFFDPAFLEEARQHVEGAVPQIAGKKVILYAPTFRGRVASAKGPDQLDIDMMRQRLGRECVLLIKHHPFVKKLPPIPDTCKEFAFQVSGDLPIDELLAVSDVCVSDYSSLVFEYSLFGRPMAFFAYDLEDYGDWRGFYYDYDELTPGPVFGDTEALVDWLERVDELFDAERVDSFRRKFMGSCDGRSTERIYDRMFCPPLNAPGKCKAAEVLAVSESNGIDVSIVIPTRNDTRGLERALESVLAQSYPRERMEILVTDDCSSDETWQVLQRYKAECPTLFKIERLEEASGSPSEPRNVGLEKASGKYVFFLDSDDYLGAESIERMLDHAVEWGSDVLLVKMRGENGREVPKSMFTCNQPRADLEHSKVLWTLAPLKLFRRELIADLRFPSDMPEDIPFVLEAYLRADCISVAADYDYYHVSFDLSKDHASVSSWNDVHSSFRIYRAVLELVERYHEPNRDLTALWRRIMSRDIQVTLNVAAKRHVSLTSEEKAIARKFVEVCEETGGLQSVAADSLVRVKERLACP